MGVGGAIGSFGEELPLVGNTKPTIQVNCEPNSKPSPSSRRGAPTIKLKLYLKYKISVRLECTLNVRFCVLLKNGGSRALFTRPPSTKFSKKTFKTGSHNTIHTFKNYFAIVFLVFSNKRYPTRS